MRTFTEEEVEILIQKVREMDKHKTNYDRIKAMSVEEMAEIIMCPYDMGVNDECEDFNELIGSNCIECCKKWLMSEVEE